jgi:hypothetical protein
VEPVLLILILITTLYFLTNIITIATIIALTTITTTITITITSRVRRGRGLPAHALLLCRNGVTKVLHWCCNGVRKVLHTPASSPVPSAPPLTPCET